MKIKDVKKIKKEKKKKKKPSVIERLVLSNQLKVGKRS